MATTNQDHLLSLNVVELRKLLNMHITGYYIYAGETMTYKHYEIDIENSLQDGTYIYYPSK
jgi:hypothetical protein